MKYTLSIIIMFFFNALAVASEHTETQFIENLQKTYQELSNFSCNGHIKATHFTNDYPTHTTITEFSIKLRKPNYYIIKWKLQNPEKQKVMTEGVVWNDGQKTYYYQEIYKAYFSFSSDEIALSVATGVSSGVAYTIPSLFLKSLYDQNNWLGSLKNLSLANSNKDIRIIRGVNVTTESIVKTELQVSQETNLIVKSTTNSVTTENSQTKIQELKKQRENYVKKSKVYAEFFQIIDPSGTPNEGMAIVESYDERIKKLSNLPQINKTIRTEIEEIYTNLSREIISRDEFQFQVPSGVKFKGNELEKLFEKIEQL